MRSLGRSAAAVVVGCLLVSGCSSGEPDQASTSLPPESSSSTPATTVVPTTSSSTPSPSPTVTPTSAKPTKPTLPAANRQDTTAGARATAVYWLKTLGYAFDSGDTKPMRAISFPDCQACANYGDAIDDVIRMGGKITTLHKFRPLTSTVIHASRSTASVAVSYLTGQSRVHYPHKKDQTSDRSVKLRSKMVLTWTSHGWKVNDLYTTD